MTFRAVHVLGGLFVCLVLASLSPAVAGSAEEDLLVYLPFENSLAPVVAGGSSEVEVRGPNKDKLTFGEGVQGRCLVGGMNGYKYRLPTAGNIDPKEGTISFWVCPLDWNPPEETINDRHEFLVIPANDRHIIIKKDHRALMISTASGQRGGQRVIKEYRPHWRKGEWLHVAVTWQGEHWRLYANGELAEEALDVPWPEPTPPYMYITSWSNNTTRGGPTTALDELRIFSRRLSEGEIRDMMVREAAAYRPPEVAVPLVDRTQVRIDGRFGAGEWDGAAAATGLVDFTGRFVQRQPIVYLLADPQRLNVAWRYEHGNQPLVQDHRGRDASVFQDDSIELWFDPSGTADPQSLIQFVANAGQSFYDSRGGDKAWNGRWTYRTTDADGVWTGEVAIPWADLGLGGPEQGDMLRFNFCQATSDNRYSSLARVDGAFSDADNYARMALRRNSPVVQVLQLGRLDVGRVDARIGIAAPSDQDVQVQADVELVAPDASQTGGSSQLMLVNKHVELAAGESRPLEVQRTAPSDAWRELHLNFKDREGRPIYVAQLPVTLSNDFEVRYVPSPLQGTFKVEIDPLYANYFDEARPVEVAIYGDEAKEPALREVVRVQRGHVAEVVFPEAEVPSGDNKLVVRLLDGTGDMLKQVTEAFYRPPRPVPWKDTRAGLIPGVPEPWEPVTVQGQAVALWGRRVTFGASLLPVQMASQGERLLSEPARLAVRQGGQPVRLKAEPAQVQSESTEAAQITGQASGGGMKVRTRTRIEFDGVMRVDLTLEPAAGPVTVDGLALELPMPDEVFEQYVQARTYDTIGRGKRTYPFAFYHWVGNDEVGLCWFAESMEGWNLADASEAIMVERRPRGNTLRIMMIDQPTQISEALTLTFGLLPTPFRPLPADHAVRDFQRYWNQTRPWPAELYTRDLYFLLGATQRVFFDPLMYTRRTRIGMTADAPADQVWQEKYRRDWNPLPAAMVDEGHCAVAWSQLNTVGIGPANRYYEYFGVDWGVWPAGLSWQGSAQVSYINVCPNSGWADALVEGVRIMADHGIPGQYFDTGTVSPCRNTTHGCGYVDRQGKPRRSLPIFAARELKKRMYKILYDRFGRHGEPIYISTLSNGDLQLPILTFDHAAVSGEEWNGRLSKTMNDYTRIITREQWRFKFGSRKWGFMHVPLPAYSGNDPQSEEAFRTLALFRLAGQTPFWPGYVNQKMYQRALRILLDFGVNEGLTAWPFWETATLVARQHAEIEVAVYRRGDVLLLIAANFSGQPVDSRLSLNLAELGLAGHRVTAAEELYRGDAVAVQDAAIRVGLEAKSFAMVRIETSPPVE